MIKSHLTFLLRWWHQLLCQCCGKVVPVTYSRALENFVFSVNGPYPMKKLSVLNSRIKAGWNHYLNQLPLPHFLSKVGLKKWINKERALRQPSQNWLCIFQCIDMVDLAWLLIGFKNYLSLKIKLKKQWVQRSTTSFFRCEANSITFHSYLQNLAHSDT